MPSPYVGRFAPSPTGVLHAGSLVAALASWLDARAHQGRWLVRIEDVDTPRCQPGAAEFILQQLARCHLLPDTPPLWQSQRASAYAQALHQLTQSGLAYPCTCSRKAIEQALLARGWQPVRHGEKPYPGTCRPARPPVQPADTPAPTAARASHAPARAPVDAPVDAPADAAADVPADATGHAPTGAQPRLPAWRLRTDAPNGADTHIHWQDRHLGPQHQNLSQEVGDFVLKRADGLWAYQLAVVVDDAAQGVTDVVRGQDLADNTPRQIHLQHALGLPTPRYLHTPLVLAEDGQKLSKQNGAAALNLADPLAALRQAGAALGLPSDLPGTTPAQWLAGAVAAWQATWPG